MILYLDPDLRDNIGHYLPYAKMLSQTAKFKDIDLVIAAHSKFPNKLHGNLSVYCTYSKSSYEVHKDYRNPTISEVTDASKLFAKESQLIIDKYVNTCDIVCFIPNALLYHIEAVAKLVNIYPESVRFVLINRFDISCYNISSANTIIQLLNEPKIVNRIRIGTDTSKLRTAMQMIGFNNIELSPYPHKAIQTQSIAKITKRSDILIGHIGHTKLDKGILEVIDASYLLETSQLKHLITVIIQICHSDSILIDRLVAFAQLCSGNIRWHFGELDELNYWKVLHDIDIIILPYHYKKYRHRSSGIFVDAILSQTITIVPQNTWMADICQEYNTGYVISDISPRTIVNAVTNILNSIDLYRTKAQEAQQLWIKTNTPELLIDFITDWRREAEDSARKALVIYPWGDLLAQKTGSALLTAHLIRALENIYDQVYVLCREGESGDFSARTWVESANLSVYTPIWLRILAKMCTVATFANSSKDASHAMRLIVRKFNTRWSSHLKQRIGWADDVFLQYCFDAEECSYIVTQSNKRLFVYLIDLFWLQPKSRFWRVLTKYLELRQIASVSHRFAISEQERDTLNSLGIASSFLPAPSIVGVRVWPEGVNPLALIDAWTGVNLAGRKVVLFVGSWHYPNIEAVKTIRRIAELQRDIESLVFVIAGHCHEPLVENNFVSLGPVPSCVLEALYTLTVLVLIPLESGTGMSVKTIEALSRGKPILSTPMGVRGIEENQKHGIFIRELQEFPGFIKSVLEDGEMLASASKAGLDWVRSYGVKSFETKLRQVTSNRSEEIAIGKEADIIVDCGELLDEKDWDCTPERIMWLIHNYPIKLVNEGHLKRVIRNIPIMHRIRKQIVAFLESVKLTLSEYLELHEVASSL